MFKVTSGLARCGPVALVSLCLSATASHARAPVTATCPPQPLAQKFLPWADFGWYEAAPDGGFEAGGSGWTFTGGARVVAGNEPFFVGARGDAHSLAVPAGGTATSAPMCLGLGHPTLRLFVRHDGIPLQRLTVSVVFRDAYGSIRSSPIGVVTGGGAWAPTLPLATVANALPVVREPSVAFSFAAGAGSAWFLDDVYVDPYGKG